MKELEPFASMDEVHCKLEDRGKGEVVEGKSIDSTVVDGLFRDSTYVIIVNDASTSAITPTSKDLELVLLG